MGVVYLICSQFDKFKYQKLPKFVAIVVYINKKRKENLLQKVLYMSFKLKHYWGRDNTVIEYRNFVFFFLKF